MIHRSLSFLQNVITPTRGLSRLAIVLCCFGLVGQAAPLGANSGEPDATIAFASYEWNLTNDQRPLLSLPNHLTADLDLSLTFPMDRFGFPLFQSLYYNESAGRYILLLIPRTTRRAQFVELQKSGQPGNYSSSDGSRIQLVDSGSAKTIRTADTTQYTFIRFADGALRCARVKERNASIFLNYTKDGLIHSIIDSSGRTIMFAYADNHVGSVTQTWTTNAVTESKTWQVGDNPAAARLVEPIPQPNHPVSADPAGPLQLNHSTAAISIEPLPAHNDSAALSGPTKALPDNATTTLYTQDMAASDWLLAAIFGGPNAVAAANGYEPSALAQQYPLYRGDLRGVDGRTFRGHLSFAMHLYGSEDGRGTTALYVPLGFTSHSTEPGPTDAAMTFYYPRLGNLTDVTLAVFHIANFNIIYEGGRVRIGNIGGPGGSTPLYRHSHIEFYRGNTGLPSAEARPGLRIDPVTVFDVTMEAASRARRTATSH